MMSQVLHIAIYGRMLVKKEIKPVSVVLFKQLAKGEAPGNAHLPA